MNLGPIGLPRVMNLRAVFQPRSRGQNLKWLGKGLVLPGVDIAFRTRDRSLPTNRKGRICVLPWHWPMRRGMWQAAGREDAEDVTGVGVAALLHLGVAPLMYRSLRDLPNRARLA